ncbi:UNVERIFIED_CONTAM: hypothetical protein FKN15_053738 [Acipenser sinensis]
MPNCFSPHRSNSPPGSGEPKTQRPSSDPTIEPASFFTQELESGCQRATDLWRTKASPAAIPYMAQESQRFSGHPPIPRPSQLPLLHPGTRERMSASYRPLESTGVRSELTGLLQFPTWLRRAKGSVAILQSHDRASFLFYTQELESGSQRATGLWSLQVSALSSLGSWSAGFTVAR